MFPHGELIYRPGNNNFRQLYEEHGRILELRDDLKATCVQMSPLHACNGCSREQEALCAGRLPSFFHDLIDLCSVHFYREECMIENELAGSAAHAALKQHHQAHGLLLRNIGKLITESRALLNQQKTGSAYRHFHMELSTLMDEHDQLFDNELTLAMSMEMLRETI